MFRIKFEFILESFNPQDSQFFQLNKTSRVLSLKAELDYETVTYHELKIVTSNLESLTPQQIASIPEKSVLYIHIDVEDVNDNPPKFISDKYTVGISERDNLGKQLLTLEANDPDLNDKISYSILTNTIFISNEELAAVKDTAFLINRDSGVLSLNFQVQPTMGGYFEFNVEARDLVDHTDITQVKIFILGASSRVKFGFANTTAEVRGVNQQTLARILSEAYEYECIIADIQRQEIEGGITLENVTDVSVHFINVDEAVDESIIRR